MDEVAEAKLRAGIGFYEVIVDYWSEGSEALGGDI